MLDTFFSGKRVLVTGACGTIGQELCRQLLENDKVGELVGVDNNESELFFLEQRLGQPGRTKFRLVDIRDRQSLTMLFRGVDIVFHTAAFKHVILCERSPMEAIQTNINGVANVIEAARTNGVGRVVFTSSDKAVNPTSVMGTSKLMGERLMTSASVVNPDSGQIFVSTRFGNVLGSRGSVIPIFTEQIRKGGPVTLTHPEMTRFIMSIAQAVRLVIDSCRFARGGEVFVTKMPAIGIRDLAEVMIEELAQVFGNDPAAVAVETIGTKPGEKLYEELMCEEEIRRTWELEDYFVVLPALRQATDSLYSYPQLRTKSVAQAYNSANERLLDKQALASFLRENDLLATVDAGSYKPDQRFWPEPAIEGK